MIITWTTASVYYDKLIKANISCLEMGVTKLTFSFLLKVVSYIEAVQCFKMPTPTTVKRFNRVCEESLFKQSGQLKIAT